MLNKVKEFLHIDADLTEDDATLEILIQAAIDDLQSGTNKLFDDTKMLMVTYVLMYVKAAYEEDGNTVLTRALSSISNQIKVSSDFIERPEPTTGGAGV